MFYHFLEMILRLNATSDVLNLEYSRMSHRKFEHPRHGSLGFLPRKRASRHRGKGLLTT